MFPVHLYGLCSSQNLAFILFSHILKNAGPLVEPLKLLETFYLVEIL